MKLSAYVKYYKIPQIALAIGVLTAFQEAVKCLRAPRVDHVGANVSVFTVFGEGRSRLVQAKWSVASLLMVKHICFDNFFLQDASGPPVVALASQSSFQMPSRCFPECSRGSSHESSSHDSSSHDSSSMIPSP